MALREQNPARWLCHGGQRLRMHCAGGTGGAVSWGACPGRKRCSAFCLPPPARVAMPMRCFERSCLSASALPLASTLNPLVPKRARHHCSRVLWALDLRHQPSATAEAFFLFALQLHRHRFWTLVLACSRWRIQLEQSTCLLRFTITVINTSSRAGPH